MNKKMLVFWKMADTITFGSLNINFKCLWREGMRIFLKKGRRGRTRFF